MVKKYLYDDSVYTEILERIESLSPQHQPFWGKMNVAQMLGHCAEVQAVCNGKMLSGTSFIIKLIGPLVKRLVLREKPYKRSVKTHPQYIISDETEFETGKKRLLKQINELFQAAKNDTVCLERPLFGKMTKEEKGWSSYKHIDHHLRQFGV